MEEQLPQVEIEYLFVDDGSVDGTMDVIRRLHEEDPRVHYVSFSRNFGRRRPSTRDWKTRRRLCGYSGRGPSGSAGPAPGDAADCDGGRLRLCGIPAGIQKRGAADTFLVCPHVLQDYEPDFQRGCGGWGQGLSADESEGGLGNSVHERVQPFLQGNLRLGGFKKKWLEYENIERAAGETKWSFWKLLLYALDGIVAFSTMPLVIASVMGILFCVLAFAAIIFIIIRTLVFGDPHIGLALYGVYHHAGQRSAASVHRHFRPVYGKDIPGDKAQAALSCRGGQAG